MNSESPRIAVVGLGVVAPGAIGTEAFAQQLREGRTAASEVTRFDTEGLRAHSAALVEGFSPKGLVAPMKLRRMNALSRLAVAATKMAFQDAGFERFECAAGRVGVSFGTAFGPVQTSAEYLREYVEKGAALAPPQLFAESVANAPGSHIAIEHDFRGFNLTFTQRESSALTAAMYAASQMATGGADAAVVGGVEEMNEIIFAVLDRIGALAHAEGSVAERSAPFDVHRNGLVVGEGSAVFLLSREAVNDKTYCWLSGFGMASDVTAPISDWGTGTAAVVDAMQSALDDAGITKDQVDAVWASANSTVRGDRLEYQSLQALFGGSVPPVVTTKGIFGEYAAGGALHLASAAIAMRDQVLFPSAGFAEGESAMGFRPVRELTPARLEHVLVNSLSAGGGIVSAVISRDGR